MLVEGGGRSVVGEIADYLVELLSKEKRVWKKKERDRRLLGRTA